MNQLPFFVYGTLRPQQPNAHLWQGTAVNTQPATFPHGTLYSFGGYPMLISRGDTPIQGNLLTIQPAAYDGVLARLDELEGFDPTNVADSPYRREERLVQVANGRFTPAWVYLGQPHLVRHKPVIASGNWLDHAAQHQEETAAFWHGLTTVAHLHQ